jgi:hypothetical protein
VAAAEFEAEWMTRVAEHIDVGSTSVIP